MKTILLFLCLSFAAMAAEMLMPARVEVVGGRLVYRSKVEPGGHPAFEHPVRILISNGQRQRVDLWKLWVWQENIALKADVKKASPRPMTDWRSISGKVIQAKAGGGILVSGKVSAFGVSEERTVFVRNYPFKAADDDEIMIYANADGVYDYVSVSGADKRVEAWNYGHLPNDDEWKKSVELFEASMKSRPATSKLEAQQKQAETEAAVKKFREEQAKKAAEEPKP